MATNVNITRGVPFAPSAASAHRAEQARREHDRKRMEKRAYGRMLDQIESEWRKHERSRRHWK